MWICLNTRKSPKNFSRIQIKSLTLTHNGFSKTMQWDKGIEDYLFIIQNEVKNENPHEQNHLRFVPLKKIQEEYFSLYISNCLNKLTQWEAKNMGEMLWVSGILMGGGSKGSVPTAGEDMRQETGSRVCSMPPVPVFPLREPGHRVGKPLCVTDVCSINNKKKKNPQYYRLKSQTKYLWHLEEKFWIELKSRAFFNET